MTPETAQEINRTPEGCQSQSIQKSLFEFDFNRQQHFDQFLQVECEHEKFPFKRGALGNRGRSVF